MEKPVGDTRGPGSGRARPSFAGPLTTSSGPDGDTHPKRGYTHPQQQSSTTEEYTLILPISCLKNGTTSMTTLTEAEVETAIALMQVNASEVTQ